MEKGLVKEFLSQYSAHSFLEYLLVAIPNGDVSEKVMSQIQVFAAKYNHRISVKTTPYITIANFHTTEAVEETVIRWIHRLCSQQKSFKVTLNNYGCFPPDNIYLRVQDHQPFKKLMALLKPIDQYIQSSGCPPMLFASRPHIIIAQGLSEQLHFQAMMDYSQEIFHESFQLDEIVLLKRRHEFEESKQVTVFRLYPAG